MFISTSPLRYFNITIDLRIFLGNRVQVLKLIAYQYLSPIHYCNNIFSNLPFTEFHSINYVLNLLNLKTRNSKLCLHISNWAFTLHVLLNRTISSASIIHHSPRYLMLNSSSKHIHHHSKQELIRCGSLM